MRPAILPGKEMDGPISPEFAGGHGPECLRSVDGLERRERSERPGTPSSVQLAEIDGSAICSTTRTDHRETIS
jgi:hypothetical protein